MTDRLPRFIVRVLVNVLDAIMDKLPGNGGTRGELWSLDSQPVTSMLTPAEVQTSSVEVNRLP